MTKTPAPAGEEKPRSIVVPLEFPIEVTIEGEGSPRSYNQLTIRRMKARDSYIAEDEGSKVKAGYRMFAALAGVPLAVIEELDTVDVAAVGEAVATMMGKRLTDLMGEMDKPRAVTGATS
ncbi:phage tail assembly protein [Pelagibacterium nitratireducens]|uniref:Phage tail assembly protein n=1 Tax=Pelagibacterium nitratireducens TaxID=1046114 RepID=A0ABZ2HUR1_9HYPH